MANWDFGENRILKAYISGVAEKKEEEQRQFKNKLANDANERAEEQLKQYGAHVKAQETAENARLDLERARLAIERQTHEINARKHIADMMGSGAMHVRPQSQGEQLSTPMEGTMGGIDPRTISYATPQELLAQHLNEQKQLGAVHAEVAGATKKAELTAGEPFEISRSSRLTQQQKDAIVAHGEEDRKTKKEESVYKLNEIEKTIEGHKEIARINGQYDLDRARITSLTGSTNPEDFLNSVMSRAYGEVKMGTTKQDELYRVHMNKLGLVPLDPKVREKLVETHAIDPLVRQMKDILDKLPESKVDAAGKLIESKIPLSDLKNLNGLIKGVAGNIARIIGGERGVLTEKDINRAGGLLVQQGITSKQGKERFAFFMDNLTTRALDVYMANMGPSQKLKVLQRNGFDPNLYNKIIDHGGTKGHLFKQAPDGEWGYWDTKAGAYKSVGDN